MLNNDSELYVYQSEVVQAIVFIQSTEVTVNVIFNI